MRVLIVEDDDSTRSTLVEVMETFDVEADAVGTCKAAEDSIRRTQYDVVLIDYWLREGTCSELTKRMHAMRMPFVLMTAAFNAERLAVMLGTDFFIRKPFDLESLVDLILTAVRSRRSVRDHYMP